MEMYNPNVIEKKWQKKWEEDQIFRTANDTTKPKFYCLVEFPYPSGQGLHVGHPRPYTALDVVARKRRMEGYNVLFPMGWDAFGLPTENYAIKNKIHPAMVTKNNVEHFKAQLSSIGYSFDWNREINTTDPDYYKWTQWIFIQMFKKGLAYKKEMPINWCSSCKIGLANEEVVQGNCERCGHPVTHKTKTQWMLKITEYAERLIQDLDEVDYPERVKSSQINWIGKSTGMELSFSVDGTDDVLQVFTTRPDTIFGATYMVIAPEHPIIDKYKNKICNYDELLKYRETVANKSELDRTELSKEKTGLPVEGIQAINPASGKKIPIWISDYVLMSYGTGAIMAVPGHDQRDWDFARKFELPIVEVVSGGNVEECAYTNISEGTMINSDFINGLSVSEAKEKIADDFEKKGIGIRKVNYKLRDWVFSRQRYWGEPIPLVHCDTCGWVPIPESELPLTLPEVDNYEPTDNGESPLANIHDWVETTCPKCGGHAHRETDTMPQWAGSSWYYLRYTDPHNFEKLANEEVLKYWIPVDWYNGGMEHTTLHLLYSRFWHKFLYDIGVVPTKEPYQKRTSHGMILGENGEKMSKSRGNVINPDEIVEEFGADTLRIYEMFIGDFEKSVPWSENGVRGARRFLDRTWRAQELVSEEEGISSTLETDIHQSIKKVSEDYENLKYNTAIAQLMSLLNRFYEEGKATRGEYRIYLQLLNPVAPHITEELWEKMGFEGHIYMTEWPQYDEQKTCKDVIEIPIQVNGKHRATISVPVNSEQSTVSEIALKNELVIRQLQDKKVVKEIYVPNKIFNIIAK